MRWNPPLQRAQFVERYKRFFADVVLESGEQVTAHCANTGSMRNCLMPGTECWVSRSDNPRRKLAFSLELVTSRHAGLAGINTARANALVGEALERGVIPELAGYPERRAEVKAGTEGSRIDWLLERAGQQCYLEVKNVTLAEQPGIALFPDTVTLRGQKHLRELALLARQGNRAVLLFCVQLERVKAVGIADHLDPDYGCELALAMDAGVEVLAYGVSMTPGEIRLDRKLPFFWQGLGLAN